MRCFNRVLSRACLIAVAALVGVACGPFDGDGPGPDGPGPDGDDVVASGTGQVTVTGATDCTASFEAAVAEPDAVGISTLEGDDALSFNVANEASTLDIDALFTVSEPLGDPPADTTYSFDASQLHIDGLAVECEEQSFLLVNEDGQMAADLPELTSLQMEIGGFRQQRSTTLSGSSCRGSSTSSCRLLQGRADVRLQASWQTGAGDEVSVSLEVQKAETDWYQET